jgi:hypothetical protein
MPGDVAAARAKVQQYLTQNFSNVNVDADGNYSLRNGSSRIFVRIQTQDHLDWTAVTMEIPLLNKVKETTAVFEHIALHADDYIFGHLSATRGDDGLILWFSHSLLGDYLDEAELCRAVGGMLSIADDLDDGLQAEFGGDRFHQD